MVQTGFRCTFDGYPTNIHDESQSKVSAGILENELIGRSGNLNDC